MRIILFVLFLVACSEVKPGDCFYYSYESNPPDFIYCLKSEMNACQSHWVPETEQYRPWYGCGQFPFDRLGKTRIECPIECAPKQRGPKLKEI